LTLYTFKRLVVATWLVTAPFLLFCGMFQNIGGTYQTLTAALDAVIVVLLAWNTSGNILVKP